MSEGNTTDQVHADFKYYEYEPNLAGNAIFIVLFGILTLGHAFFQFRQKTWYWIPFTLAMGFEAGGYVARVASIKEAPNFTLTPFLVQTLLILLAPALLAASIYMVLGRLIRLLDAHEHAIVRVNWLTKIFVAGDVLSFLTQSAGGGLLAKAETQKEKDLGTSVVLAGLAIQIVFFGLFIVTTILFDIRMRRRPTSRSFQVVANWKQLIFALYLSSVLVLVRSVFRMIEFGAGKDSVLMQKEVFLLVLDGALIFGVGVVFLWRFPGEVLVGYKDLEGKREERVPGSSGSRSDVESRGGLNEAYPMVGRGSYARESKIERSPRR
ncbi:RTA1 like protein-domain-containing protein [Podospora australis]|uniref:RTA1 like protein-domain-containing protein n=1 Tax=Podospora australis TaxID=1536484 RepID=A0AAN6WHS1_9PEZI|nr:RTA1 like protein-domain-containing protein [Podospora australis]